MDAHPFDLDRIGHGLPVARARDELDRATATGAMVVTAPPGTGKTTLLPPLVANRVHGRVLVTQPRRVAVRAAARRIAELDGSVLGERVGLTVRGERILQPSARIEVLTPGVLLRRLLADPALPDVGAVLLDEVHERSLETDLLLGMLAEARLLRDDLLVGAMSATLEAQQVADLLDPATIVEVPSALHPLEVRWAPGPTPRLDARGVHPGFLRHVAQLAREEASRDEGDVLVFLPGAREVDAVVRELRGVGAAGTGRARVPDAAGGAESSPRTDSPQTGPTRPEVLPLHGRLPVAAQDRATRGGAPGSPPRIIVSTAVAESSLTVPGVRAVVDAGLDRQVRRDRQRDMTGLVTVSASQASATQRAGRAARQGPGRVVRAYAEEDFARMPQQAPPEITTADLTDAMLWLASWGTPRGDGLPLLTPPPALEVDAAQHALHALGLVEEDGSITEHGREVALLPIGVREARALHDGSRLQLGRSGDGSRRAAEVTALLSGDERADGADLAALLRQLRHGRDDRARRWRREADRLERLARTRMTNTRPGSADRPSTDQPGGHRSGATNRTEAEQVGAVVALARPDWIARCLPGGRTVLLAAGTRAALPPASTLIGCDWVAVWDVQRAAGQHADGTGAVVRAAAALHEDDALAIGAPLRTAAREVTVRDGTVSVREVQRLGAITLRATPVAATRDEAEQALLDHVTAAGLDALTWSDAAVSLRYRLGVLHRELGAPWPDVRAAALCADLAAWLGAAAADASGHLDRIDLLAALRALLPWPEAAQLDALAPEHLEVPSGSRVRLLYPDPDDTDGRVVAAVKLQEMFGLAETPMLLGGRVRVQMQLLSPARRPLAVTDDLRSFWDGPYQQVRRDMRGRYPKHPWPEDPWSAPATARTRTR
ncbi:ATP-dependent RNA helicase [Brachybacterium timonense]|uniref:ATP-dependent RNA helicase n=1 Tax=Brachybacterium timonense TaxID=2050896 RepID=UPI001FE8EBD5|nr:ATP-dependent helicase C-terminal domain-containing protein [Brachybacterium timonense]